MLVETSAIVAIALEEPNAAELMERIDAADQLVTTVVNAFEAALSIGKVLENHSLAADLVPKLLDKAGIEMIGIEANLYEDLVRSYARFGKGTAHPARLNFGDCFSYAVARRLGKPLLYVGDDFPQTDIARA